MNVPVSLASEAKGGESAAREHRPDPRAPQCIAGCHGHFGKG